MLKEARQGKLRSLFPLLAAVPALIAIFFLVIEALDFGVALKSGPANRKIGQQIDSLHGVPVYYNGPLSHDAGMSVSPEGYAYGRKYQCTEFVLRYFHAVHGHTLPDIEGRPKDFFDPDVAHGERNERRGLFQYTNGGNVRPEVGDLIIFDGLAYGEMAIVSEVAETEVEIIQQNRGPHKPPRERLPLHPSPGSGQESLWTVNGSESVLGWLRP